MDNLDDSENTAKVSDSAYSNSCSNSQCRRSHSSKSTHSGSHSSGSSGYGGKPSTPGSSKTLSQLPETIKKDKEGKKKKKQVQKETVENQSDVEFRLPDDPAPITGNGELENAFPPPVRDLTQNGVQRSLEVTKEDKDEQPGTCNTAGINQSSMQIVMSRPSEGFSCVISMHDGVVLYMSPSLTATLGFPKDIWIGRSFIDFVHPLDHNTFASQMTSGLVVPKAVNDMLNTGNSVSTIFCRIRRYRSLSAGFNIKERTLSFMPFMLQLNFKNVYEEKGAVIYLVIQAMPVFSAFKTPNEVTENAMPFIMRHLASGTVEYIDNVAVPFLGYLPQDITSKDVLKLYHPEDLPYLKHVYETVVKYGRVPRSKPYRLMAQNGDYIKFETEWSSFRNPWSRKLEFVIGKHYVTEGPANPDVFQPPPTPDTTAKVPEANNIEIEGLRASIVRILNEVSTTPAELVKQQMTKRCQDLASFMESVINEQPKVEDELRLDIQENDNSYYERDSVMLGGISPHHDYGNDSKSSSETLLSYNQLNYNINLKRYFDSHQESFDEDSANITDTTMVALREHSFTEDRMSPIAQCSGDSLEMTSVESPCVMSVEETPVAQPHDYRCVRLTELIMTKHNSEMEKIFVKKHRESRTSKKEDREKLSIDTKQKKKDHLVRCNASFVPATTACSVMAESPPHGLKRPSKHAEVEPTYKHHCVSSRQIHRRQATTPQPSVSSPAAKWPQNFVNGMTPFMPQQMPMISPMAPMTGFVPMYYMPTAAPAMPCAPEAGALDPSKNCAQVPLQAPAVQYIMYGQAVFGSPIMVSPINHQATFPRQSAVTQNPFISAQSNIALTTSTYEEACKPGVSMKPASKAQLAAWREESRADAATSTRGGVCSGSGMCSATNALNRSKEVVPEPSALEDSKLKSEGTVDRTDGESCYSSFYSSFFKTESGSAEDSGDAKKKQNNPNNSGAPTVPENDNLRNKQLQRRKKEPPWMEQVCVTSELIYKYQVVTKSLDEVLLSDRMKLAEQPSLVNEQLGQLYMDLQLEGVAARLTLEEGITSSGSSSDDENKLAIDALAKRARSKRKYSKLVMIYEEDTPLPSPDQPLEPEPEPEPQPSTSVA